VIARLCAAAQQLLDGGARVIEVTQLARAAQVSVVTTRKQRHERNPPCPPISMPPPGVSST
jgi:hypothetical protein